MMLSGERHEQLIQLDTLLAGYEEFMEFDPRELALIEPLRAMRIVHYMAWLARRWEDPAFPRHFPGSTPITTGASRSRPCTTSWKRSRHRP